MNSRPRVSIIILTCNALKWLTQFLPSLVQTEYDSMEIIVADNHSSDAGMDFVRDHYPQIKRVFFEDNFGFSKGNNKAAEYASGDYLVLLNSDIELTPHWLTHLIEFMEAHPEAGACQSKLLSYVERSKFEYAGASGGFIDKYGYTFCRGRIFEICEEDRGQYDTEREIFWATGACLCVRRSVWNQVGGLEEDFFIHMEEIDWCWRARLHGYKIYCVPQSVVYHVGGGTLAKQNPHKTYLNYRNNLIMLQKNLATGRAWRVLILRLFLDHLSSYRHLLRGHLSICLGIYKAHLHFLVFQRKWIRKRMRNQEKIRRAVPSVAFSLGDRSVVYPGNIAIECFFKGKKSFSELEF